MGIPIALAAAGIGAVGQGLGTLGNALTNRANRKSTEKINQQNIDFARESNEAQRKWEREQMDYQNRVNMDFWNMQNDYNSPINQVARMRAAGLNPALMYGSSPTNTAADISAASGGAARNHVPNLQAPKYDDLGLGQIGGAMMQAMQFSLQQKMTDAQVAKLSAETMRTIADTPADTNAAREWKNEMQKITANKVYADMINTSEGAKLRQQQQEFNEKMMPLKLKSEQQSIARSVVETEYTGFKKKIAEKALLQADVQRALSTIELQLMKMGVNKNDPGWYKDIKRMTKNVLDRAVNGNDSLSNDLWPFGN